MSASYISLEQPTEGGRRRNLHYTKKKKVCSLPSSSFGTRDSNQKRANPGRVFSKSQAWGWEISMVFSLMKGQGSFAVVSHMTVGSRKWLLKTVTSEVGPSASLGLKGSSSLWPKEHPALNLYTFPKAQIGKGKQITKTETYIKMGFPDTLLSNIRRVKMIFTSCMRAVSLESRTKTSPCASAQQFGHFSRPFRSPLRSQTDT